MSDSPAGTKPIRVGVYSTVSNAESAIQSLQQAGFHADELSVLCNHEWQKNHFPDEVVENVSDEEAAKSAGTGSLIGALLGGATTAAGLATVAGIPIIVAGTLAGVLTGGIVGGLAGAMAERGFDPETADYFDQSVSQGKILIAVEPANSERSRLDLAEQLLRDAGAEPLSLLGS